jgi:hypothetical protein
MFSVLARLDSRDQTKSGPGQIWTGDLPVISRTLQPD